MRRSILAGAFLLALAGEASAACSGPVVMHDFPGSAFNMSVVTNAGDGNCASAVSVVGTAAATQSGTWNIGSITTLPALVAGSALIGKVGIDQTTPGATNLVSIGTNGTVNPQTAASWGLGTFGSAIGTIGHNLGMSNGTNLVAMRSTAYGTTPTGLDSLAVNAFVTNTNANGQATAANSSPVVLPAAQVTIDPCTLGAKTNLPISQSGTSSVQLIALSGSTTIYVCSLSLIAAGATTAVITTGTGTACVTGNAAVIGDTTANIANGLSFAANGGLTLGNGAGMIAKGAASGELCMTLGTNVRMSGNLTYVQQ